MIVQGRCWVFGDNLDIDWQICDLHAIEALESRGEEPDVQFLVSHCLTRVDPGFPHKVLPGDLLVAGQGFGYTAACLDGHPGDPHINAYAAVALRELGVAAVVCESAVATFERNCIELGLPIVECHGITRIAAEGDELRVDFSEGSVLNTRTGAVRRFRPLPPFLVEMMAERRKKF